MWKSKEHFLSAMPMSYSKEQGGSRIDPDKTTGKWGKGGLVALPAPSLEEKLQARVFISPVMNTAGDLTSSGESSLGPTA